MGQKEVALAPLSSAVKFIRNTSQNILRLSCDQRLESWLVSGSDELSTVAGTITATVALALLLK